MKQMIKNNKLLFSLAGFAVLLVVVIMVRSVAASRAAGDEVVSESKPVTMLTLGEYRDSAGSVRTTGQTESLNQVELKSQVSAKVQGVYAHLGDHVRAGQTLVVLDGAELSAQVAQAAAGLEAEEIRLKEMQSGARPEEIQASKTRVESAKSTLADAERNLQNTQEKTVQDMRHAYTNALSTAQRSVEVGKSTLLLVTDLQYAHFLKSTGDNFNIAMKKEKAMRALFGVTNAGQWSRLIIAQTIGGVYSDVKELVDTSSETAIASAVSDVLNALQAARFALDFIPENDTLSATELSSLAAQKTAITNEINALVAKQQALATQQQTNDAALAAAEAQVTSAKNALKSAQDSLDLTLAGSTAEQIAAQQTRIKSARASLYGLQAQLAKTVIRAPFGGTVASVPVTLADLVSPGQSVVTIVDASGLQIRAHISSGDRARVAEGAAVLIEEAVQGTLAAVAPSIDPSSGKVEILVTVTDPKASLTVGEVVDLAIEDTSMEQQSNTYIIPLTALQTKAEGSFVYTLNDEQIVEEIPVSAGAVVGERIHVAADLSPDTAIIATVRGLQAGDKATVR